jgi:hypothetical protein
LWFLLSPQQKAHADEITIQISPTPAPISDTATATVVTIATIDAKVESATSTLNTEAQLQSTAIINAVIANNLGVDTQTATSIAISTEPMATAISEASTKVADANTAINAATSAIQVAQIAQTNVETQTATVAIAQSVVDTSTVTSTNAQVVLTTETNKLPDLQATQVSTELGFYTENSNLGTATSNVQTAQTNLTNAQTDLANSQPTTVVTNGVKATTYAYSGSTGSPLPTESTTPLSTTTVASTNFEWGSGQVLNSGRVDNVIVKFEGTITLPDEATLVRYNTYADDGTKLYIDGQLAINNWRDQGAGYSQYSQTYNVSTDKQQDFVLWYYEHGGGASVHLGWMIIRADGTGYFTFPQASAFSSVVTTPDPVKVAAVNTAQSTLTSNQSSYSTQLTVRDAAYQAWQDAIHAVDTQQSVIDSAQAAYDIAQQNLTTAQQNLTTEQQNLTTANQNLTISLQTADTLANTATAKVNEAVTGMQNATTVTQEYYSEQQRLAAEQEAARQAAIKAEADRQAALAKAAADKAAADAALAAQQAADAQARAEKAQILAEQAAKEKASAQAAAAAQQAANEKAAAEAKAAEDSRIAAEQAAKEAQAAADKAKADAEIQAAKDAQAAADAAKAEADKAKAEADAKAKDALDAALAEQKAKDEVAKKTQEEANAKAEADKAKAEADKIAADQAAKDQAAKDAKAKSDAQIQAQKDAQSKADEQKAADDKAKQDAIGVKPNSPNQLSDTVVKEAPKEVLVPHIQQDTPGIENGGIQFFGTKSAPQVVGEDGKITPPAPPPGSGLPIPPDAITTQDTFIGQPGGTTFNAPDIAVPVIETPVTGTLAIVPGVQALNHAFVAMSNIGNDMSPVTRKKAKKILVLTIAVAAIRRRFN